jgi:CubicO group peptidase (beta-lactamase class C family)
MKKFYAVAFLLFVSFFSVCAQESPSFITDSLDIYVNRGIERWQIPGAAVLVIKDGKVVVAKGYGVKELGTNDKVDENTLFMIGSNTKAFTGTALAILEQEGKCKLDDKVVKYLPDFKMKDEWVTKELNLTDIVTHRMGLETFQGDFMYWTSDLSSDEVIEKFGKITPNYSFRTKYGYTNAGYAIAGKIIEKISGLPWSEYLKEIIFVPLKMNRTLALSQDYFLAENIAKPHTYVDGKMSVIPFQNIDNLAPCGSIGSSIKDLSHWVIAQLDSGRFEGETVIPVKVLQRTRKPESIQGRVRYPFNKGHFNLYGLGWGMMDYEGTEIISHTGGVNGFVTSVTLLPEKNLGIVVLTNTDQNAFFQMLKWEIVDAYLGLPYRNYDNYVFERSIKDKNEKEKQIAELRDSVAMNIETESLLSEFSGRYENDVYGYAEINQREKFLELSLEHHSKLKGKLEYIGNNRFLCTYSDPTYGIRVFPFEIKDGKVLSFDLYVDDFIEFLPYKFIKK